MTGLSTRQAIVKRTFDIAGALVCLLLSGWLILLAWVAATIDTRKNGIFTQTRVGRYGRPFKVMKIRTMREVGGIDTTVTTARDPRVTRLGHYLRLTRIDELPQLINILLGRMSFVGPRPDVPGFADKLEGEDRLVLSVRPGMTGPATLRFRDEAALLENCADPERYNHDVIFPEKVRLNLEYIRNYSFGKDLTLLWSTILPK